MVVGITGTYECAMKTYGTFRVSAIGSGSTMEGPVDFWATLFSSGLTIGGATKGAVYEGTNGAWKVAWGRSEGFPDGPLGAVGGGPVLFAKPGDCVAIGVDGEGGG